MDVATAALVFGAIGCAVAFAGEWLAIRVGIRIRDAKARKRW